VGSITSPDSLWAHPKQMQCLLEFSELLLHFHRDPRAWGRRHCNSFHTFNATADMLIRTFCQTDMITEATETFKHLLSFRSKSIPTLSTCNILLSSLVRWNWYVLALSVYVHMIETGIRPNLITFSIVINCNCETGRMDYAFKVFEGMETHGYIPDVIVFSTLIKGLCREGRMEDAVKLFKQMVDKQQVRNTFTYSTLIDRFCKTGKTHEAFGFLAVMLQKCHEPNTIMFTILMDRLCKLGKLQEAKKTTVSDVKGRAGRA
jgi:pentatricopeptide repeat protein